jgi:hypothetical protein
VKAKRAADKLDMRSRMHANFSPYLINPKFHFTLNQYRIVSFTKTLEWDEIIKYAEGQRENFELIRNNKPKREVVTKALDDLLENIKLKNCTINKGYLNALGVDL